MHPLPPPSLPQSPPNVCVPTLCLSPGCGEALPQMCLSSSAVISAIFLLPLSICPSRLLITYSIMSLHFLLAPTPPLPLFVHLFCLPSISLIHPLGVRMCFLARSVKVSVYTSANHRCITSGSGPALSTALRSVRNTTPAQAAEDPAPSFIGGLCLVLIRSC